MTEANELADFIRLKIDGVESSIVAREQSEATFNGGTGADWKKAADMHPSTRGRFMTKTQRIQAADMEGRIPVKLRHERDMFLKVLAQLNKEGE